MGPMDALSQKDEVYTKDNNQGIALLQEDIQDFHICTLDTALAQKISKSSLLDPIVAKALAAMNNEKGEPWIP